MISKAPSEISWAKFAPETSTPMKGVRGVTVMSVAEFMFFSAGGINWLSMQLASRDLLMHVNGSFVKTLVRALLRMRVFLLFYFNNRPHPEETAKQSSRRTLQALQIRHHLLSFFFIWQPPQSSLQIVP